MHNGGIQYRIVWLVGSGSSGFFDPEAPSDAGRGFYRMRVGGLFRTLNLQAFRNHWEHGVGCCHVMSPKYVIFALTCSVPTLATNNGSVVHLRAFLGLE